MPDEIKVDDLVALWQAGAVHLPKIAIQYALMAQELHGTAVPQVDAFQRSIGGPGRLYQAWTDLRDLAQDSVAVRSYDNLLKAGEALQKIAGRRAGGA